MSKAKKQKNANKHRALSAQQTIPYIAMHPDGICQLPGGLYTKTLEYEDINYAVASTEDQTAIISGWSACLNYFDSSLPFQLSFVNRRSRNANRYKVNIPAQEDDFNSIRGEYVEMLKGQIAKSNNGIERYKYITFGLPADGATEARPRLGRVEADVMGNLKRLGVQSRPLDGRDRLAVLHGQMHPGGRELFRFAWKDIPKTGMGTKDYIAPDSFDFRQSRTFRVGQMWGAASYLQIMASELSDKLLAEILELDAELTVTMHIQTVDQLKAIKTIKGKISDIGRMKAEEQKKAVRAGYDMEILPPDLITFSKDAAELLSDLQSRNERMFLLTFTVVNLAPTRQRLENDVFTVSGIAQKYNCALRRLDWQQEQGFVSSLALGYNGIEIQRGMTTSSTAIFIPFTRLFRGAFGVGGMFSRPPLFSQKCFPHPSAGTLGHFVPKSRLKGGIMPKYYEISEAAAKRAKDMNSYSDYAPGSATTGYQQMVDEAYALAEKQKAQVDPMYHDKIDALVDRYARRLAENLNERNAIDARVPSILITGGGNFPVAKKAKQNAARDRNYGEYAEIEKLLDKIRSTGRGGISADDDLAVEKLTKKLEGMESQQATMKAVNAYYRKHKTLEGCPELTAEQVEKVKASMSQDWRKDPVPFPSYLLTNNNANIRRVRQRIEELSHKAEFVGWTFPGGEAKVNETENRLQLVFAEKPDADTRQALKSEGFKWAPSQGAWQRQLNQNAIRAAARLDFLRPEDGKSPYQLQTFAKRAEKDVSR